MNAKFAEWLRKAWDDIPENQRKARERRESPEVKEQEEAERRAAEKARAQAAERAYRAAGVPEVTTQSLKRFAIEPPQQVTAWARAFRGRGMPWMWITGGTGAGKTTAACWALREVADRAGSIAYLSAPGLKALWDGGALYGSGNKHERLAPYAACGLLVLDDLGKETIKQTFVDALCELLDSRYNAMLPTLITSQHGLTEYQAMLARADGRPDRAAALASRIKGAMGGYGFAADTEGLARYDFVELFGADRRAG